MRPGHWYRISGDGPDLGLTPTAPGTRYLADNDPARDPRLNPLWSTRERLRRLLGRERLSPWSGRVGFRAITEAWNSAVFASRCGPCGSMVVYGGGHADYYGADVHTFDLASRTWARISDGWLGGTPSQYGEGARYPAARYPNGSPLPPHTYDYVQYDPVTNDYLLAKGQLELGDHVEAVTIPHLFNLTQRRWRHGPRHPHAVLNSSGCSAWDAVRRVLWTHSGDDGGGNAFIGFAPDADNGDGSFGRWTTMHDSKLRATANGNAMQHLPTLDLLGIAAHDFVAAAPGVVAVVLVGLERGEMVVGVLARHIGIGRINRLGKTITMTTEAGAFVQQLGHRRAGLVGRLGSRGCIALAAGFIERGHVGHVLFAQAVGNPTHGRVLALALLVGRQRGHNVGRALARNLGHLVDFGEAGLIALDAMAANAHGDLVGTGFGITLDGFCMG